MIEKWWNLLGALKNDTEKSETGRAYMYDESLLNAFAFLFKQMLLPPRSKHLHKLSILQTSLLVLSITSHR